MAIVSKRHLIPARPAKYQVALVAISAALVLSAAMGIRQTFGLFVGPFS